jgi:predicted GNAT superfamily acetyltransferase
MAIAIRPIYALADMYAAVALQRVYWGNDLEAVVPAHMLFSLANHGGHVLVALDDDRMVGVLIGFLGTDNDYDRPAAANLQMVSKRMVVLPEYRNQGLAYQLKMAQRDAALEQNVRLVTWTFDPMLAPNAHLNIRKLGAVCPKFRENYYGTGDMGGLTTLGTSDRLFVEWWVSSRRVKTRVDGKPNTLGLQQYLDANVPLLNPTLASTAGTPWPADRASKATSAMALLEIPRDFPAIVQSDETLARAWQQHVREQLQILIDAGYIVTDFIRDQHENRDRVFYVFSQHDGTDLS